MSDNKVTALNPTVRRALGNAAAQPATVPPPATHIPAAENCPRCHDIGLVYAADGGLALFTACPRCRTRALGVYVARIAPGRWIAVRDIADSWGVGPCAMDAFLDLERRTPESASVFARRYLREFVVADSGQERALERSGRVA